MKLILCLALAALIPATAVAQPPVITDVRVARDDMGWKFSVTILHPDTGWDHYANGWDIMSEDGTVLATRVLHHPHVDEQPFTRSLRQVVLPDGTQQIFIRAHCSKGDRSAPGTAVKIRL
ncbi:hypothetical protein [Roseovarius sp. Pro17]|uniref:hypothetical protein n=1 Tax=Roseovarius sp. Pro17 TaxID=3108175 RepID=UPI002D78057A|nr:hypothetical protein [Roseovarius sp. Pro17]